MAGTSGNGDLDQWKKALLSRNFDLVHTQLLMLDGDVTPSERVQLVEEIFLAVQQIEELTIGNRDSHNAAPAPAPSPKQEPTSLPGSSRPADSAAPVNKIRRLNAGKLNRTSGKELRKSKKYKICPVCELPSFIGPNCRTVRHDWYCNSCRLFKLRLDRRFENGNILPSCDHKGTKIRCCKGCRRFRLQSFWMAKRNTPYSLPLVDKHGEQMEDAENSDPEAFYDCELE